PTGGGTGAACDASLVIAERAAFWWPLAEDQERPMMVDVVPGPVPVHASGEDLAACTDILLENVFSHTPEGCAFAVKLSRRAGGGGGAAGGGGARGGGPRTGGGFPGTAPRGSAASPAGGHPAWGGTSPSGSPSPRVALCPWGPPRRGGGP